MSKKVEKFLLTNRKKQSKIKKQMEVRKIKNISVQQWLPIEEVLESGIIKEKKTILNSYKILLKTCNFNIQILIQSNKEDLSQHIKNIEKNIQKKENKYLKEISENYVKFIQTLNYSRNSASKDFYLIISNENLENFDSIEIVENDLKEKYFKIKECLSRCGNDVIELNEKKEIFKIFYSLLNTRKFLNN